MSLSTKSAYFDCNRRKDREPGDHSRICSNVTSEMGKRKLAQKFTSVMLTSCFRQKDHLQKKKKKQSTTQSTSVQDMVKALRGKEEEELPSQEKPPAQIILEAELDLSKRELKQQGEAAQYQRTHYSASTLTAEVIRMETRLPTKEVFQIVVNYASRFKDSLSYYAGWKVESILFEDQFSSPP